MYFQFEDVYQISDYDSLKNLLDPFYDPTIVEISRYVFEFLGMCICIARVSEPYVYNNLIQDILILFRSKKGGQAQNYSEQPLCSFANSVMSIEFL